VYPTGTMLDPFSQAVIGSSILTDVEREIVHQTIGFHNIPQLQLPVAESLSNSELEHFHVSPLQVALASAALSAHGIIPAPSIASAVNTPSDGWVTLPVLGMPTKAIQPETADEAAQLFIQNGNRFWSHIGSAEEGDSSVTWYIAGTPPNWGGTPIVVVILIEDNNIRLAERIGEELIVDTMNP